MGKGRAPCCDKSKVKRGPWNPAEDLKLITFIHKHGHENWRALPKQAGLLRCGKSCRLRWINYLRPDVKRGNFTQEEQETIIRLRETLGNKWSKIASYLPGRTDNEIKNVWNTHLKKKLAFRESSLTSSSSSSSTNVSSGKTNADTEFNEHHNYVPKKSHESKDDETLSENVVQNSETEELNEINDRKEMKITKELSSSSCSSDKSLLLHACQVDATRAKEQTSSSHFGFSENFTFGTSMNNLEEVNKPEIFSENGMEIPLESDFDFWDMLDSLGPFQSNEVEASQSSSSFGEAGNKNREVESRKWFEYLENELGLEATGNENRESSEKMVAETTAVAIPETYEIMLKPEVDPAITYFQLWNSPESSVF